MPNVGFQKTINRVLPVGQGGDLYSNAPMVVTAYMAETDIVPGTAVFNTSVGATTATTPRKCAQTGDAAQFCGIATRMTTGTISDLMNAYSNIINESYNVQVLSQGEVILKLTTTAAIGDNITFDPATGALAAGSAGTASPFYVVDVLDAANFVFGCSSWRKA